VCRVHSEAWLKVGASPHAWLSYMSLLFHKRTIPSSDPVTVYLQRQKTIDTLAPPTLS
jgi:hypothetical protein